MRELDRPVLVTAGVDQAAVRGAQLGLVLRSLRDRGPRSRARADRAGPGYGARRSANASRQHFLDLPPEPTPGTRICSSLYAWRCEVRAISIGQTRGLRGAAEGQRR